MNAVAYCAHSQLHQIEWDNTEIVDQEQQFYTVKNWRLILTQKRSSQLQSGFSQIQAVALLLLPGFRGLHPLSNMEVSSKQ